jgi:hypothetical protein
VFEVLQPLEVRASDTTTVGKHVRNNNDATLHQGFLTHEGGGTVGTLEHNFAVELIGVVDVNGLLNGSWKQNVAWLCQEAQGVQKFFFAGLAVTTERSVLREVVLSVINVQTIGVVDSGVVLNDGSNLAAVFLDELASPVADSAETLDIESLAGDAFGGKQ